MAVAEPQASPSTRVSDELRKVLERLEKSVEKLDKGVRLLATDVAGPNFKELFDRLAEDRKETDSALRSMAASQAAMGSGISQALAQLTRAPSPGR